jgi:predicted TIM-barrel fold metal-dependent hydrolase
VSDYAVIDNDGHLQESLTGIRERLAPRWQRRNLFPGDAWDRDLRGKLGQRPQSPQEQIAAMDADGIDVMVLYPTAALSIGRIHEEEYTTALARAYNDWLYEFCQTDPARLKGVAILAPRDPQAAADELHRAVTELGFIGAMLPTHVPQSPDWGHRQYDPIYAAAERLDVGLGFHTGTSNESLGSQRFQKFLSAHTLDHPVEQMVALIATILGGVFERFPRLRVAYLESGVGWVPYMMDRLDEEVEKRGADETPYLTKRPSDYIRSGNIFFGVECEEKTIPDGVRWGLEDMLLYASDYPHWDGDWPHTVQSVRKRTDLSDELKRKLLHDNALLFYGSRVETPATAPAPAR